MKDYYDIKIPELRFRIPYIRKMIRASIVIIMWGGIAVLGFVIGKYHEAAKYDNCQLKPVTVVHDNEITVEKEVDLSFYNKRAVEFLERHHILEKLPKNYKIGSFEAFAIAQCWYGDEIASIADAENGVLICSWAMLAGNENLPWETARQTIIFIGNEWPGEKLPNDYEGKYTKELIRLANRKDMAWEKQ